MGRWIEKKVAPRLWKFTYSYTTNKKPKRGFVRAKQYAIKRTKDVYDLILKGKVLRKPYKPRKQRRY